MTAAPEIVVARDENLLADSIAARLLTRLVDAQADRGKASLVLTGGGIGTAALRALAAAPARDAVDWQRVDIWWGDERFVSADSADRNDRTAQGALLDRLPLAPARVHPMGGSDTFASPEDAAEAYAEQLADAAGPEGYGEAVPRFDVLLLGLGPDGHVASLFPEHPAVYAEGSVVGVHGSPKPPPLRVSLTMGAITAAREVWLLVSSADKAPAVAMTLSGAGPTQVPAAGARGRERTLLLLDAAAAGRVPTEVRRRASS